MKKQYCDPEMEILLLENADVLTVSISTDEDETPIM